MPITGREVDPKRICQISHITGLTADLSLSQSTHNLDETTCIALIGLMKQLCDIATYADEIFGDLFVIAKKTVDRSDKLHKRLTSLTGKLITREGDIVDLEDIDLYSSAPGLVKKDQTLLTRISRPKALKTRYEYSEKVPALREFAVFGDDGVKAHLMYSDPNLCVNAWLTKMDKEVEQFKKHRKRSFKKASRPNKIATLKKKVHDPKSKTWTIVDVEPQYATLPLRGGVNSPPQNTPITSTLNRKKYANNDNVVTSPDQSTSSSFSSPVQQVSFEQGYEEHKCSTPISSIPEDGEVCIPSPSSLDLASPTMPTPILTADEPMFDDLPPPPDDLLHLPFDDLPLPPPLVTPLQDNTPPPFLPPPVPDAIIKPVEVTFKQRVLRTRDIQEPRGLDTLLDMIRTSSFNLKPINKQPLRNPTPEPTYATYQGTDVASILQRRKYLMGVDLNDSEYDDSSDSDDGGWD